MVAYGGRWRGGFKGELGSLADNPSLPIHYDNGVREEDSSDHWVCGYRAVKLVSELHTRVGAAKVVSGLSSLYSFMARVSLCTRQTRHTRN